MNQRLSQDFAVLHHIHDPAGWVAALERDHSWPEGFALRSFVETEDGRLAICIWIAPSRDELQQSLDATLGHAAVNELHPVEIVHWSQPDPTTG